MTRMNQALAYYEPLAKARYDDYPKRMKDLEHLLTITARYQELQTFLNDLTLEPPSSLADVVTPTDDYLTLSTVHSAKGLEWDAVFVIWAAEGRFPGFYSQERDDEMEEERRLMYVAVTRAKRRLNIFSPTSGIAGNRHDHQLALPLHRGHPPLSPGTLAGGDGEGLLGILRGGPGTSGSPAQSPQTPPPQPPLQFRGAVRGLRIPTAYGSYIAL